MEKWKIWLVVILVSLMILIVMIAGCGQEDTEIPYEDNYTTTIPPIEDTTPSEPSTPKYYANITVDSTTCSKLPGEYDDYLLEVKGNANASTGAYLSFSTNPLSGEIITSCPSWGPSPMPGEKWIKCFRNEGMPEYIEWTLRVEEASAINLVDTGENVIYVQLGIQIAEEGYPNTIYRESLKVDCPL